MNWNEIVACVIAALSEFRIKYILVGRDYVHRWTKEHDSDSALQRIRERS